MILALVTVLLLVTVPLYTQTIITLQLSRFLPPGSVHVDTTGAVHTLREIISNVTRGGNHVPVMTHQTAGVE
jgi:hypothetical protein